jgi:hypothetical protein
MKKRKKKLVSMGWSEMANRTKSKLRIKKSTPVVFSDPRVGAVIDTV